VRWTLDLPDTLFSVRRIARRGAPSGWQFTGRGWGHGVGLTSSRLLDGRRGLGYATCSPTTIGARRRPGAAAARAVIALGTSAACTVAAASDPEWSMLRAGIVGLPNVGKSTLFNALTRTRKAEAANYPFCTIEPNVGWCRARRRLTRWRWQADRVRRPQLRRHRRAGARRVRERSSATFLAHIARSTRS
jgi:hypothetical protein